jgi:hypothetical protein
MADDELKSMSPQTLLLAQVALHQEFKDRGFMRNDYPLVTNLAEVYYQWAFRSKIMDPVSKLFYEPVTDPKGFTSHRIVKIKGAALKTNETGSIDVDDAEFDDFVLVVFDKYLRVHRALRYSRQRLIQLKGQFVRWKKVKKSGYWYVGNFKENGFWGSGTDISQALWDAEAELDRIGYVPDEICRGRPTSVLIPKDPAP